MIEEADNPKDVEAFERLARRMAAMDELRTAIGSFLVDFAHFESLAVTGAIRALTYDDTLVEQLTELMELSARLKLLKRLGEVRGLPNELQADIANVRKVAIRVLEFRNEVAHGPAMLAVKSLDAMPSDPDTRLGVLRAASKRQPPGAAIGPEQLAREMHEVPVIREWNECAIRLQNATIKLAQKLGHYKQGSEALWRQITIELVPVPSVTPKS